MNHSTRCYSDCLTKATLQSKNPYNQQILKQFKQAPIDQLWDKNTSHGQKVSEFYLTIIDLQSKIKDDWKYNQRPKTEKATGRD